MPRGGIRLCSLLWPASGGPECWGFHWAVFEGAREGLLQRLGWGGVVPEQSLPHFLLPLSPRATSRVSESGRRDRR